MQTFFVRYVSDVVAVIEQKMTSFFVFCPCFADYNDLGMTLYDVFIYLYICGISVFFLEIIVRC